MEPARPHEAEHLTEETGPRIGMRVGTYTGQNSVHITSTVAARVTITGYDRKLLQG